MKRLIFAVVLFTFIFPLEIKAQNITDLQQRIDLNKQRISSYIETSKFPEPNFIAKRYIPEETLDLARNLWKAGEEYRKLAYESLSLADQFLKNGDTALAEKYFDKALGYDKVANINEDIHPIMDNAISSGIDVLIAKMAELASTFAGGVIGGKITPIAVKVINSSVDLYSEYRLDLEMSGSMRNANRELIKNIIVKVATEAVMDGGGSDFVKNPLGAGVYKRISGIVAEKVSVALEDVVVSPLVEVPITYTYDKLIGPDLEKLYPDVVAVENSGSDSGQQPPANPPYIPPNLPPTANTPPNPNSGNNSTVWFSSSFSGLRYKALNSLLSSSTINRADGPAYILGIHPGGKYAYIPNWNADTVSAYTIDSATGSLSSNGVLAAGSRPSSLSIAPSGKFVYVTNGFSSNVSMYSVNQTTGLLSFIGKVASGSGPGYISIDPLSRFAYVINWWSDNISIYSINQTTGELIPKGNFGLGAGTDPYSIAFDSAGKIAYITNANFNTVTIYSINQTTGTLTSIGGSVGTGTTPLSIAIDSSGKYAYVANYNSANVSAYSINQTTGNLTFIGNYQTSSGPQYVTIDPSGKFLYVANYSSSDATVYMINELSGSLTFLGSLTGGNGTQGIAVDSTGHFAYVVSRNDPNLYIYDVHNMSPFYNGTIEGSIIGLNSMFVSNSSNITMSGVYNPVQISNFTWGNTIFSYNSSTNQNTTYDNPVNSYAGFLTGYISDDSTMKARWASIYVKHNGSAGIHLGTLTGTAAAPDYTMSGTINAPVEMVSSGIGFTPANLYPANVITTALSNGVPILTGGSFDAGGAISPSYHKWESLGITGQDWGVWRSVSGGTYTGPTSSGWSLSEDYNYVAAKTVAGNEMTGVSWAGNKLEGTNAGYGADMNTGKTWVSIGDVIGTYDPVAITYQAVASGAWIETNKFLWMAGNEPSKLQALNIPCVQVGNVNLAGSNDYGTGTMNVTMNNVKFFSNTAGGSAQIWAAGQSQMGNWTGAAPSAGTAANIAGGGLSATFTVKTFDTTANNWNATITNGAGGFNGSTTFRGAAAGTVNTAAKTFSGTAAGVAK